MDIEKKGRGRPAKYPGERRTSHTFRLRDSTRQQIIADAQASGRSVSEEIEWKVETIVQWERAHGGASMMAEADMVDQDHKDERSREVMLGVKQALVTALRETLKPEMLKDD